MAVFGFCELWGLVFALPPGEALYNGAPMTFKMGVFLVLGSLFAILGPAWPWVKTRFPRRLSASVARTASDFRYWLYALSILFVFLIGPDIYQRALGNAPAQATGIHGGAGGQGDSAIPNPEAPIHWTNYAHLTLTFDNQMQAATPTHQDGVRFYYWKEFQGAVVNFETRQISPVPGSVIVFMSLNDPTYTNFDKAVVVGGGITVEVVAKHAAGAVVLANGDMRGRTLDIILSKDPIPLN